MAITVYWANGEPEWMLATEPESVSKLFHKQHASLDKDKSPQICPAFNDLFYNVYAVRSIYDYEFTITPNGTISSSFRDQEFFNSHVIVRSLPDRLFSFAQRSVFFTDADSLLATIYEFPVYEDNNITKRCQPISGTFDIGKWFRNSEFAFFLKKDYNSFVIEKGEVYMYIRFHTKERIIFKQFRNTQKIGEFLKDSFAINSDYSKLGKLQNYYDIFRNKKLILKEIQNNLIN